LNSFQKFIFLSLELTRQFSYAVHWSAADRSETYFISSLLISISIPFELYKLGKSLYYIRFIWCVVCTNDRGLPQTMLRKIEEKKEKKFSFCSFFFLHLHPTNVFIFLIKLIRKERRTSSSSKKSQIKDVLSEFIPPCTTSESLFLKVMSRNVSWRKSKEGGNFDPYSSSST
jgi:hypothetical protein